MIPYCYRCFAFHHSYECAGYDLRQRIWTLIGSLALPVLCVIVVVWIWR